MNKQTIRNLFPNDKEFIIYDKNTRNYWASDGFAQKPSAAKRFKLSTMLASDWDDVSEQCVPHAPLVS